MATPLHQRIAEDLLQKIGSGELPVGGYLPTELALMGVYGASRNTVRTALQTLQARGLISRRRNRGTMVEAVPGGTATFTQSMNFEGLLTLASTVQRQLVATDDVVLDIPTARVLQAQPGSTWVRLSMLRTAAGKRKPLCWTDAYVDPHYRAVGELAQANPGKLLADLIENRFGRRIETVEQTVACGLVTAHMAPTLGAARGTPALHVLRHYRDAVRTLVIVTRSVYPEGRYAMTTSLVRSA